MTSDHIRIRDLELIIALHETGNATRAAERVGISEPAVSQQMRKIQHRLKVKLFERRNGGVVDLPPVFSPGIMRGSPKLLGPAVVL